MNEIRFETYSNNTDVSISSNPFGQMIQFHLPMAKFSNHSSLPSPFQPFIVILIIIFFLFHTITTSYSATLLNVLDFGAIRGGGRDSSPAFRRAWAKACTSSESTIVYVPKGRFLVRPIEFHGGCGNNDISFHIDGALVAPSDYRILGDVGSWLSFDGVDGVTLSGGVLDANGAALWDCKASAAHCPVGAMVPISNSSFILKYNI